MPTTHRASIILTVCLLATTAHQVGAQMRRDDRFQDRWGSDVMPRSGVCLYEDPDFKGAYFCLEPGEKRRALPKKMRDEVSSIRVIGNVSLAVFKDERFRGASGHFLTDVSNLKRQGWNDKISSVRVASTRRAWDDTQFPGWGLPRTPRQGACFYRDADFKGEYFCMERGGSFANVPDGFNDKITSIRLIRASGIQVFSDRDFEGASAPITENATDMRHGKWNDKISSLRVF